MKKEIIDKWKMSSRQLLCSFRQFMQGCSVKAGRGLIGEILVFERLICRYERKLSLNDNNYIKFLGSSKKGYDIHMVINDQVYKINAKGTTEYDANRYPRWVRQHARSYAEILVKKGKTYIEIQKKYDNNLFYVFVDIKKWLKTGSADYYILSDKEAKQVFGKKYKLSNDGKKVRRNNSDDMWIEYRDIRDFKDNSLARISKL